MGGHPGFDEFFEAEYRPLRRFGYLLTGDWAEAEELAQDAMVRTYRAWRRITERDRPGAYARRVLVNRRRTLLARARVAARHAEIRREAVEPSFDEESYELWQALRTLPQRQRAAIVLRYYEDLTEADAAAILDVPLGTLKSLVHRGLSKLRLDLAPTPIPNGSEA